MKEKLIDLLTSIYALCMFLAVFAGAVTAAIYVLGFIVGGGLGEACAKFGADIMQKAIPLSAAGSVIGMIGFYVQGRHELTMGKR
jgi:uncharacterized membrane protein required for colicin V production